MRPTTDGHTGLHLFNSMGRARQEFSPTDPRLVKVFTSGPLVHMRPHMGDYRKFLFADLLVRYLRFKGHAVRAAMGIFDVDHRSMIEVRDRRTDLHSAPRRNELELLEDLGRLGADLPDRMPRSSRTVDRGVDIIKVLLRKEFAYRHEGDIFFDPLRSPSFGRLSGMDMSSLPTVKRRFRKETYGLSRRDIGDFILWHGCPDVAGACRDREIGIGIPSSKVHDPAMAIDTFGGPVDIWCGGEDDLVLHHDQVIAVAEAYTGHEPSRFWLHVGRILIDGKSMSKGRRNVVRPKDIISRGLSWRALRFCLIDHPWREPLDLTPSYVKSESARLDRIVSSIAELKASPKGSTEADEIISRIAMSFRERMDDDLDVKGAVTSLGATLEDLRTTPVSNLQKGTLIGSLRSLDSVLKVLFQGQG